MNWNKTFKIGTIILGFGFLFFIGEYFYVSHIYGHKWTWGTQKRMAWILTEEYRNKIKNLGGTAIGQNDNITYLNLDDTLETSMTIWEIKSTIPFEKISIDTNYSSNKINLTRYETINKGSKGIAVNLNYKRDFEKSFKLGISNTSSIKSTYSGQNYIGVFGEDLFEFYIESDFKTDIMILNDWKNPQLAVVLYKKKDKIYLIMIKAEKEIDESIIEILNLE